MERQRNHLFYPNEQQPPTPPHLHQQQPLAPPPHLHQQLPPPHLHHQQQPPNLDQEQQHPPLHHPQQQLQYQHNHLPPPPPQQQHLLLHQEEEGELPRLPYIDSLGMQLELLEQRDFDLLQIHIEQVLKEQHYPSYQEQLQFHLQLVHQERHALLLHEIQEQIQQQQQQSLNAHNVVFGVAEDTGGAVVAGNRVPQEQHLPHPQLTNSEHQEQPPQQEVHITYHHQQQQSPNVENVVFGVAEDTGGSVVAGNRAPQFTIQDPSGGNGGRVPQLTNQDDNVGGHGGVARDDVPQWTDDETKEFLLIQAELNQNLAETRNQSHKKLWEVISKKMEEKGYNRSSEELQCRWKTLNDHYREINSPQTMEADQLKENFPYYDNLKAINEASKQKGLMPGEGGEASGSVRKRSLIFLSNDEDDNGESGEDRSRRKRARTSTDDINSNLKEVFEDFVKQQMQWQKAWEARWEAWEARWEAWEARWEAFNTALLNHLQLESQRAAKRDELNTAILEKLQREKDM